MANQDAAFGFRAVRHLSGGTPRTEEYLIGNTAKNDKDIIIN